MSAIALVSLLPLASPAAAGADSTITVAAHPDSLTAAWARVESLGREDLPRSAGRLVDAILVAARALGDQEQWTHALIERANLHASLGGYETAVRYLRRQPWPDDPLWRAILDLYLARSLVDCLHRYGHDIRQRERVGDGTADDPSVWTAEQFAAEVDRAYRDAWTTRDRWGDHPLEGLECYIEQNDYPPGIRDRLRDAFSYFWVAWLADTSWWRPEHDAELSLLDIAALSTGGGDEAGIDPADPDIHPLRRLCAVLGDLERWHRCRREPAAALEARLNRLDRLYKAVRDEEGRRLVRGALQSVLRRFDHDDPWWSRGQALLAWMLRGEGGGECEIKARRAALAGYRRHPDSWGGRKCRELVEAIEAPSFSIETMACDAPGRRTVRITHRNLDRLYFRAYRIDLPARLGDDPTSPWPHGREALALARNRRADATWTADLPRPGDYRDHHTYTTLPIGWPGAYLLVASVSPDLRPQDHTIVVKGVVVGDLVMLARDSGDTLAVTVVSGATGDPVRGATVTRHVHPRRGPDREVSLTTDEHGRVAFTIRNGERTEFLLARKGLEVALLGPLHHGSANRSRERPPRCFVYTDRAVYRPGQTIHWKVVAYGNDDGPFRFRTLPRAEVHLTLRDAKQQVVAEATVRTNEFGSASGAFEVPAGRILGNWWLRCEPFGSARVRVEEYRRPSFAVTIADPGAPLRLNREVTLQGEASYFFGRSLTHGRVAWRVTREPLYPAWYGNHPIRGALVVARGRATLDDTGRFTVTFTPRADPGTEGDPNVGYAFRLSVDVTDAGGETRSARRTFRVGWTSVTARLDLPGGYVAAGAGETLTVVRTNLDGDPLPGEGAWELYALRPPDEVLLPAEQPLDRRGVDERYLTPGDRLRPRWSSLEPVDRTLSRWPRGRRVAGGRLRHGEDGRAALALPALKPGAYRLVYRTRDDHGAESTVRRDLLVAGRRMEDLALPLVLRAERGSVPVGGVAHLLVSSGLPDQPMTLELFRDGRCFLRRELRSGRDTAIVPVPVTPALRGGFLAVLTAVRDHQLLQRHQRILVPWDDRRLQVTFTTFRDHLQPGTEEVFRVSVRGPDGRPVEAAVCELLACMYDRSLDLFGRVDPPDPLSLYPRLATGGRRTCSLGRYPRTLYSSPRDPRESLLLRGDKLAIRPRRWRSESWALCGSRSVSPRAEVYDGLVEDMPSTVTITAFGEEVQLGSKTAGLARSGPDTGDDAGQPEPVVPRSDFRETAFFRPHLRLGEDGEAAIEFRVPEAVTGWHVWVQALTTDLRAGTAHRTAVSSRELQVRAVLPRFLREGDRTRLTVLVDANGDRPLAGRLTLELRDPDTGEDVGERFGLAAATTRDVPFRVEAGGTAVLTFPLSVPSGLGLVVCRVTARAADLGDGEQRPLPVLPGRLHLASSRFVALQDDDRRELSFAELVARPDTTRIDEQLVLTVDARLLDGMLRAVPFLLRDVSPNTAQLVGRYLGAGILERLYGRFPVLRTMAGRFAGRRRTRLAPWRPDPNRRLLLEETPWLALARGGRRDDLVDVLDPAVAAEVRVATEERLAAVQDAGGGFPWRPGHEPDVYMTLLVLEGLARGTEFGLRPAPSLAGRAWDYLHREFLPRLLDGLAEDRGDLCLAAYLDYVLSCFPPNRRGGHNHWSGYVFKAAERRLLRDYVLAHRRELSPRLKACLAMSLARDGRGEEARRLLASLLDAARNDPELGVYWATEEHAWLWYEDTVESHTTILRALLEITPDDPRRHGLVRWLLLNRKLGYWRSTRTTAEVLYTLARYLEREGSLATSETVTLAAGPVRRTFRFSPGDTAGNARQLVVPGARIDPMAMATITATHSGRGTAFVSATWHYSTDRLPAVADGDLLAVTRRYFRRVHDGREWLLQPLSPGDNVAVGDELEVHLEIRVRHAAEYVHLRDPRAAGCEPEDPASGRRWSRGLGYYYEARDSGADFFFDRLPAGRYTLRHRLRVTTAGTFRVAPAVLQSVYAPEFVAYSAGERLVVE